jgi:long-chain acyl-CoA synthetase
MEARVADLDRPDVEAAVDRPGELWMRGPLVMTEYFGRPDATAEVLAGGWLRTGDLVRRDAEGNLWVVDRCRDLIISGGYNVYPAEIERVLSGHPAVALVAVGPVPDEVKGEVARAYVVLRDGRRATEEELIACARAELAAYKTPRSVVFVPALPQTSSGKIMRRMLRELPVPEKEPGSR